MLKVANSDRYGRIALAMLCNGAGGADAESNALAASLYAERFAAWFYDELPAVLSRTELELTPAHSGRGRLLTEVLRISDYKHHFSEVLFANVSDRIRARWQELAEELQIRTDGFNRLHGRKMRTTMVALILFGNEYLCMRIGTECALVISAGALTEVLPHPGTLPETEDAASPEFEKGRLKKGMRFLLCPAELSDRIRHPLTLRALKSILFCSERCMAYILKKLCCRTSHAGSRRNASAVALSLS